ncbi:formate dehydrogenase accessory sulfurtransferase FdhD [Reyranella aquatilis]|uniref:Sulfur carrier protein FdhD n=1 Tax=Reyranella aquatilis TaxID=2035356 RepID=A0ABS8KR19_9HYPH|nr:formate dehydrogenase accessory sulfurtransferase FdhD [Reyranella aquatilis]MCC8428500.1 formate dehydrogenase accessory sulfurtransferase FdhD [Reyranella aquatilis]
MSRDGTVRRTARRLTAGGSQSLEEAVAEEVAVALVYNGISHAVMMATPCDLEDFARGFSLTERIVEKASEIYDIEAEPMGRGIEVRLEIAAQRLAGLQERRRSLAGRTGCGLCGVDSLDAALRTVPSVAQPRPVSRLSIERAMAALPAQQRLNRASGALHAAAWAAPDGGLVSVREDVGRHNALDKLAGALARSDAAAAGGFVVVTSRCSYEMVQKAAAIGASAIAAVSAPTSLAIETAEQAGIALVAFVREGRLTAYACADRIAA